MNLDKFYEPILAVGRPLELDTGAPVLFGIEVYIVFTPNEFQFRTSKMKQK